MMYNYPFFGFPNFRRRYYYPNPNYENKNSLHSNNLNSSVKKIDNNCNSQKHEKIEDNTSLYNEDSFDFFGLKLHFDDLLIIALLFFLYKEEIDDIYLFIALFLLLAC